MHIVDIPAYFFPHQGGIEMMSWCCCREWVLQGHYATLVSTQSRNAPLEELRRGIRILRVPAFQFLRVPVALQLRKRLQSLKHVDVVRLHYPHPYTLDVGVQYCLDNNIPYVLHMHGKEIELEGIMGKAAKMYNVKYLKRAMEHASMITAHTQMLYDQSTLLKEYKDKFRVISSGMNFEYFNPEYKTDLVEELGLQGKKIIVTMGVLRDYKGVHYLVSAMRWLAKRQPDAVLLICGNGPEEKQIRALVEKYKLQEVIRFMGELPSNERKSFYKIAHVYVQASPDIREGFGLAAAGAIAMNTPCIVTSGAGISEQFQKLGIGYVVLPKSDIAIADMIDSVLSNYPTTETLHNWREIFKRHNSWDVIAKEFTDVFHQVLDITPLETPQKLPVSEPQYSQHDSPL